MYNYFRTIIARLFDDIILLYHYFMYEWTSCGMIKSIDFVIGKEAHHEQAAHF